MIRHLAIWLSRILHPLLISPIVLFVVVHQEGGQLGTAAAWVGLALLIIVVPAAAWTGQQIRRGTVSSWSIPLRQDRHRLYALGLGSLAVYLLLLYLMGGPQIAFASIYAAALAAFLSALVNRYLTKISLHALALTGCAAILLITGLQLPALFAFITLPFLFWSRWFLREHSLVQLGLGALIAGGSVMVVLGTG
jgi:hypothetical protein